MKNLNLKCKFSLFILNSLILFTLNACSDKNKVILDKRFDVNNASFNSNLLPSDNFDHDDLYMLKKSKAINFAKNQPISLPLKSNNIIYSLDKNGLVTAFSTESKNIEWTHRLYSDLKHESRNGGITRMGDNLYITNGSRYLFIIDANDGHAISSIIFDDVINTKPVFAGKDTLLLQTASNKLAFYDINKFDLVWEFQANINFINTDSELYPVVHNGNVIVSYSSGEVYCFNIAEKKVKWVYQIYDGNEAFTADMFVANLVNVPIIDRDYLYLTTSLDELIKLEFNSGKVVWKKQIRKIQNIVSQGDVLFVTTGLMQLLAFDKNTGDLLIAGDVRRANTKKDDEWKNNSDLVLYKPFITKISCDEYYSYLEDIYKLYSAGKGDDKDVKLQMIKDKLDNKSELVNKNIENHNIYSINILASDGYLYRFLLDNNKFNNFSIGYKVAPSIMNYIRSCCSGELYIFSRNKILN